MHLQGMWHEFMADAGNAPGAQKGDVIVTLISPVGGIHEVTVPSNDVTIAAEAGNLIGVQVMMPDGRHLFVGAQNLAGMVDAPLKKGEKRPGPDDDDGAAAEAKARQQAADEDLEARVPAANRTPEQTTRAVEREQRATADQRRRAAEAERDEAAAHDKAEAARAKAEAADERDEAAAHDKAEAAHDKSEAAADKATVQQRRTGR